MLLYEEQIFICTKFNLSDLKFKKWILKWSLFLKLHQFFVFLRHLFYDFWMQIFRIQILSRCFSEWKKNVCHIWSNIKQNHFYVYFGMVMKSLNSISFQRTFNQSLIFLRIIKGRRKIGKALLLNKYNTKG